MRFAAIAEYFLPSLTEHFAGLGAIASVGTYSSDKGLPFSKGHCFLIHFSSPEGRCGTVSFVNRDRTKQGEFQASGPPVRNPDDRHPPTTGGPACASRSTHIRHDKEPRSLTRLYIPQDKAIQRALFIMKLGSYLLRVINAIM